MTAIMLVVVNSVSALVHLYSFGYMAHDDNWGHGEAYKARFFAYLSFFTFAMLMLITSDNLVQMFFGWEGVGVASYLLIGFYYRKPSATAAAIKAFVGDRGSGAERHQARDRLFDLLAAWLHVRGGWCGRLSGGDVPPLHARLLQGHAVPWRRLGHPCDAP